MTNFARGILKKLKCTFVRVSKELSKLNLDSSNAEKFIEEAKDKARRNSPFLSVI